MQRVELGGGPGLVVGGTKLLCGATRNCQTWMFLNWNNRQLIVALCLIRTIGKQIWRFE